MQKKLQLLFVPLFGAVIANAQYVETNTNIINCKDMPVSSTIDYTINPNFKNNNRVKRHQIDRPISVDNGNINARVSIRFRVAENDQGNMVDWATGMGYDPLDNSNLNSSPTSIRAVGCAGFTEGGDSVGWRLPTQRELMIIAILNSKLKSGLNSTNSSYYWSATEVSTTNACYFSVDNFHSSSYEKHGKISDVVNFKIRCVKDLPPL